MNKSTTEAIAPQQADFMVTRQEAEADYPEMVVTTSGAMVSQVHEIQPLSTDALAQALVVNIGSTSEIAVTQAAEASEPATSLSEVPTSGGAGRSAHCQQVIKDAIQQAKGGDCGVAFEPHVLSELAYLKQSNQAAFQRAKTDFKNANSAIRLMELDRAIKELGLPDAVAKQTHHGYAQEILAQLTVDGHSPVSYQGCLYVVDPKSGLWIQHTMDGLAQLVANSHDGKDHCKRNSDYKGIAAHAVSLVDSSDFFAKADRGLACTDGFYRIDGDAITMEPLTPIHRQRVKIDVIPCEMETPLFDTFLDETFASSDADETAQQKTLLQEIAGAIALGLMPEYHKGILFYDPKGRAGKGTLERILRQLVPAFFVKAVSPFLWDKEYYIMSLAGARLNVVGELPENKAIPADAFNTMIGGDLVTGRDPAGKPISFTNEAAHLFMSNHLIKTTEQTGPFFARWMMFEFPNSRLQSGLALDTQLSSRIIEKELPGIVCWALGGAIRLQKNKQFSPSKVHDRLMQKWRRGLNSLEDFIHEECELLEGARTPRAEFYESYRVWCGDNGKTAYSKGVVKTMLANNTHLRIVHGSQGGTELFRGVRLKVEPIHVPLEEYVDPRF